jgi:hypothetical protein
VHAPKNGSEAIGLPPDEKFSFAIAKGDGEAVPVTEFFKLEEPKLENWTFAWFEGKPSHSRKVLSTDHTRLVR